MLELLDAFSGYRLLSKTLQEQQELVYIFHSNPLLNQEKAIFSLKLTKKHNYDFIGTEEVPNWSVDSREAYFDSRTH